MPPKKTSSNKRKATVVASASSAALDSADGPQVPESLHEQPGGPRRVSLRFGGCIHEEHKQPVYALSFFEPLPMIDSIDNDKAAPLSPQYFASVGTNRATVYKIAVDGTMSVAQAFIDEDEEESFYATAWTHSVAHTPLLLISGFRGLIKVIDCQTGAIAATLVGHGNAVNELRAHPMQPALVLSASKDESIRLWNVYTSCCIAIFAGDQGHRDEVLSIDIHLLGNVFASCGMDNTVKVWSLQGTAHTGNRVAHAIDQSYDSGAEAGGGSDNANLGPLSALLPADSSDSHSDNSGGGAAASSKKRFQTLLEQFPLFSTSHVHSDYVDCVRWVGNLLLSKSTASSVVMWKPDVFAVYGQQGTTSTLLPPVSANTVASDGSPDSSVDAENSHGNGHNSPQPSIDSNRTVAQRAPSASDLLADVVAKEGESSLWSYEDAPTVQSGAAVVLREFEFRDADIWFVRFSLDPRLEILAVGNKFGKLWLWNVDGTGSSNPLVKAAGHVKCTAAIRQTIFSPDRRFLLCCCEDGSIWKWAVDYAA